MTKMLFCVTGFPCYTRNELKHGPKCELLQSLDVLYQYISSIYIIFILSYVEIMGDRFPHMIV